MECDRLVSIIRDKVQCSHTKDKASALARNPVEAIYHAARGVFPLDTVVIPALDDAMTHIRDYQAILVENDRFRQHHPKRSGVPLTDQALAYAELQAEALEEGPTIWPTIRWQLEGMGIRKKPSPDQLQAQAEAQRHSAYLHAKHPSRYIAESLWASIFHPVQHEDHQALRAHCRQALQQFEQETQP